MKQLLPRQLADWLADPNRPQPLLLDVRESWEYELCHLPDSLHIPMHLIPVRSSELPKDREIVAICHHGGRSMQVAMYLEHQGFAGLYNLAGGVNAWACEIDSSLRRY